ncbi:MAG: mycothiol synthase [Actinobacteria bacterium]|uniref:Unannotated protein n=1 Tax=freshwater metagenome TaxID=449393 RepID=A0A6J6ZBA5_9ZZZZ|nr:mycothiol synthase [Actinomycetota bacterium]
MQSIDVSAHLDATAASAVFDLIGLAEIADGYRPVSDQFWVDLTSTTRNDLLRIRLSESESESDSASAIPVAYAQVSPTATSWSVELVVRPDRRTDLEAIARTMMDAAIAAASAIAREPIELSWLVYSPTLTHEAIAESLGLAPRRRLYQMRRSLPTNLDFTLNTRPFTPGADDDAWLHVNRRAFSWHAEQGQWTHDTLNSRMSEPWFDPTGFLLHERDSRLAGFCWTKIHSDTNPSLGEIYVIAVDPDFHGLGLGRALTLAGLHNMAERGITVGMLFVDADNTGAVALYTKLGFTIHRVDCMYQGTIDSHPNSQGDAR